MGPVITAHPTPAPTLPNGYRVWLDIQAVQTVHFAERGIARFVAEHARALIEADAPVAGLGLNPARPRPPVLAPELADATLLCWATASEHRRRSDAPLIHHVMSPYEDQPGPRLFPAYLGPTDRVVATVYDLIPDVHPRRYLADDGTRATFAARRRSLEAADLLLCISEHTAGDVVRLFDVDPERVKVVGAGVSPYFCPAGGNDVGALARAAIPELRLPFVLSVTGDEWRKNTSLLFDAFARVAPDVRRGHQLVIVCALTAEARRRWCGEIVDAGLRPGEDVVLTGRVDDEVLRDLYRGTSLFVFPSRYEGFGLPVVEAARCGAPVLVANRSSLPSLLDEDAALFDPDDPDALADHIDRALTDSELRRRLLDASARAAPAHTWEAVAARTLDAYQSLPEVTPSMRRRRRPRLALVGPFPRTRSGVATYNASVVRALGQRAIVDCYAEGDSDAAEEEIDGATHVLPIGLFDQHLPASDYDAVVFTIGNSAYHERTLELATSFPGVVWLHDVSLAGLAVFRAHRAGAHAAATAAMAELITETYGRDRLPPSLSAEAALDPTAFARAAVRFAALATRRARHVVVGSRLAAHEVVFDLGGRAAPPISVIPLASPSPAPAERSSDRPVVASLGVVGPIKRPDVIIDAMALLARSDAVLRFVGPCEEVIADELRQRATLLGIEERVEIVGWVDAERYFDEIRSATLIVQLRAHSHGESSAAVLDALACGVPVVTSVASCAELPPDAVTMVTQHAPAVDVAAVIDELLEDDERRKRATKAGLDYAASWTIDAVADALLRVVDSLE